jgi:hypothetical protein
LTTALSTVAIGAGITMASAAVVKPAINAMLKQVLLISMLIFS